MNETILKFLIGIGIFILCMIGIYLINKRTRYRQTGSLGNALQSLHEFIEPTVKNRKEVIREAEEKENADDLLSKKRLSNRKNKK